MRPSKQAKELGVAIIRSLPHTREKLRMHSETAAQVLVLVPSQYYMTLDLILKVFARLGGKEIIGDLGLPFLSHLNSNRGVQSGM